MNNQTNLWVSDRWALLLSSNYDVIYGTTFLSAVIGYYILRLILPRWRKFFTVDTDTSKFVFVTFSDDFLSRKLVQTLDQQGFSVFAGCDTHYGADKLKQQCSQNTIPVLYDLRTDSGLEQAYHFIIRYLPPNTGLWAIIHNFSVIAPPSILEWTNPNTLKEFLDVNLRQSILLTRMLLPWIRRSQGRVVMTTTEARLGYPTWLEHHVVSGGVLAFCDYLRLELYKTGVSVHTVGLPILHAFEKSKDIVRHRIQQLCDDVIPETQGYYGDSYANFLAMQTFKIPQPSLSTIIDLYTSSVTHAYPKQHYTSSQFRSYSDVIVHRLPRRIALWWRTRNLPLPEGIRWHRGHFEKVD